LYKLYCDGEQKTHTPHNKKGNNNEKQNKRGAKPPYCEGSK